MGAFLFTVLPQVLPIPEELRLVAAGIVLLVFIVFMPDGIYPALKKYWMRLFMGPGHKPPPVTKHAQEEEPSGAS